MAPLRSIAEIQAVSDYPLTADPLHRTSGGRVLIADHDQIAADFPWIVDAANGSGDNRTRIERMETWLMAAGSVLSAANLHGSAVNQPARPTGQECTGYRPPRYGRAAIVETRALFDPSHRLGSDCDGLVDVKGCGLAGAEQPSMRQHGSGLVFLPDALREFINRAVLERLFAREGIGLRCLPFYGLVDLGIRGENAYFSNPVPCVTIIRQALIRFPGNIELPAFGSIEERTVHAIELLLRSYGITSTSVEGALQVWVEEGTTKGTYAGAPITRVPGDMLARHLKLLDIEPPQQICINNIQLAAGCSDAPLTACLTDLEHFSAYQNTRSLPFVTLVHDRPMNWGTFCRLDSPDWQVPIPEKSVDLEAFGIGKLDTKTGIVLGISEANRERANVEGTVREALRLAAAIMTDEMALADLPQAINDFAKRVVPD